MSELDKSLKYIKIDTSKIYHQMVNELACIKSFLWTLPDDFSNPLKVNAEKSCKEISKLIEKLARSKLRYDKLTEEK